MAVIMLFACMLAFLFAMIFGRRLIPWMKKKEIVQPIKKEVEEIYEDKDDDTDGENGIAD